MSRQTSVRFPSVFGGVSGQPPELILPSQVIAADNADFSIVNGFGIRPGSWFVANITDMTDTGDYRLHPIVRDGEERYLVVYGEGELRVFNEDGEEENVTVSTEAQNYLDANSPTSDQLRLRSIADATFIVNTTVPVDTVDADINYTVTSVRRDYNIMSSYNPAPNTYHEAEEDVSGGFAAGFFQYVVAENGFASWLKSAPSGWRVPLNEWDDKDQNPMGFKVRCQKVNINITGGAYEGISGRITKAGAFTLYQWTAGDEVYISGGGVISDGYYTINARIDDDIIDIDGGGGSDDTVNLGGISQEFACSVNFYDDPEPTMEDIAEAIEESLQDVSNGADAANILVNWEYTGANAGRFQIISPYRGVGAAIVSISAPDAGYDLSGGSGRPFHFSSGTATAGTGTQYAQLDIVDRWNTVASPGSMTASIDPETMPVRMTRTSVRAGATPAEFDVDVVDWGVRASGTDESNPVPELWTRNATLSDIAFFRDRLWLFGDEFAVASRSGDYYEFYIENVANLADSDPIDVALSSEQVTVIDFAVPHQDTLVIFTKAGRQFELATPDDLTPATAAFTPSTDYRTLSVRPQAIDAALYFATADKSASSLYEYAFDEAVAGSTAVNVSAHVPRLVGPNIRSIATVPNERTVVMLEEDASRLKLYRFYWSGNTRQQSAWMTWTFHSGYRISDIAVIDEWCYMLVNSGNSWFIERVSIAEENTEKVGENWVHAVRLDRRQHLTGVWSSPSTTWTLGFTDATIDKVVLGPDHGPSSGNIIPVVTTGGSSVGTGDYDAGPAAIGRSYTMLVQLNRPFLRDEAGVALVSRRLGVRRVLLTYQQSSNLTFRLEHEGSADQERFYIPTVQANLADGVLDAYVLGDADRSEFFVECTVPRPCRITEVEFMVDADERRL